MGERPPSFVTKWGQLGESDGKFVFPMGLAVDSSANVYVADMNMDRIQKFDSDGTFSTKWGSAGEENGELYLAHPAWP
jgi:tripartite motif-containing protein 71